MKSLPFLTMLLVLFFCNSGCVKQLEMDFVEMEVQEQAATQALQRSYNPKISSITDYCGAQGNYEKVLVTHTKYATTVILDIFSEDGTQHIARYTRANPEGLLQLLFTVGNPLDGTYGCSFLSPGTTYRIRVSPNPDIDPIWYPWDSWPLPNVIDEFTTIDPCTCQIRK